MTAYLLDTNIWIAIAKGERTATAELRKLEVSQIATCSVVKAELLFGARNSHRVAENLAGFQKLLQPFVSLPFDDRAAEQYGILRTTLERAGLPIGGNDLLIASIALANDCCLVTRNTRELGRVPGLPILRWL